MNTKNMEENKNVAELKKITFVNTGRFSYGEVNVNGNTLITGTNGAGKTTTILAILFFYGTTTRHSMGLLKSEGKEDWFTYTYPNINSYVIYEYRGVFGRVLLITYHAGTRIGYRFASLDDDLTLDVKSLTLTKDNVPRKKEDIFAKILSMGLKLSQEINSASTYRQILYGAVDVKVDRRLSAFADYALMRTKNNYNLIHEMQSSVFLSSKIESGAIEKAIADNFGNGEDIDIIQIQGQVNNVIADYEAIGIYDKEKKLLSKIFKQYDNYKIAENKLKQIICKIIAGYNYDTKKLPLLIKDMQSVSSALQNLKNNNSTKLIAFKAQRDTAKSEFESVKSELNRATFLFEKYKNMDMEEKAFIVNNILVIEQERDTAKKNYNTLIGNQNDVAIAYEKKLQDEKQSYKTKEILVKERIEKNKHEAEVAIENFEAINEKNIEVLEKKHGVTLDKINKNELEAEHTRDIAKEDFIKSEVVNPFVEELNKIRAKIYQLEQALNSSEIELKNYKDKIHSLVEKRELNENQIVDYCNSADEKQKSLKQSIEKEIKKLTKQLEIDENTLLYFIRENMSEKENLLTYFLSEKALYNKMLKPSVLDLSKADNTIFGININQDAIEESVYTAEKITEKINECNRKINDIVKDIENELEEKKKIPLKRIAVINKELIFTNKDINETSYKVTELNNQIIEAKSELYHQENSVVKKWQKVKDRHKKLFEEAEKVYRTIKDEKNNFQDKCNLEISGIKNDIKNFKINERDKYKRYQQGELKELKELKEQFNKIVLKIEQDKNEALINGGVDSQKLKEAEKLKERTKIKYNEAYKLIESVAVWKEDKKTIDLIPQLQKKLNKARDLLEEKTKTHDDEEKEMRVKEDELLKKLNAINNNIGDYERRIKELKSYIENDFKDYIKKYALSLAQDEVFVENVYNAKAETQVQITLMSNIDGDISRKMNDFVSKFGNSKNVWFTYDNSNISSILESVKSLKFFIQNGGIDNTKELVARAIRSIQDNISARYNNLKTQRENIHAMVDRISRRLSKAVDNIVVLDEMSIKYEKSDNRILQKLEDISNVELPYGEINSLFAEPTKSKNSSSEILKKFGELLAYLEVEKAKSITIADTFEIKIKAVENGNSTGWVMARKRIGSEGTSIIIKTLLYVVMLDTVLSMTKKDQSVLIHILVDEVGKIDQKNLREIINFSNNLSISMLSASPDAKTPDLFNHIYYYKIIKGKTKIILGAKKV